MTTTELLDQLVADEYLKVVGNRKGSKGGRYRDVHVGGILRRWAVMCERVGVDEESLVTVIDVWHGMKLTDYEIRRRLHRHMVTDGEFIPLVKDERGMYSYPQPEDLREEADRLSGEAAICEAQGDEDQATALRHLEATTRQKIRIVKMIRHSAGVINRNKVTGRAA